MYGIFAMLFGLSFFIMNDNQQQKDRSFSGRFAWRMCLLLIPVKLFCLVSGITIDYGTMWEQYAQLVDMHQHGTFWENAATNLRLGFVENLWFNVFSGRLTQLLCLFILGMQLGRQRLFYDEGLHLHVWHALLIASATAVVTLILVDFGGLSVWLHPVYNLTILCMIVSAVVSSWYASHGVRSALRHLCTFGRMSLTNYLLQSVIGCFIFCGYGLACYRRIGVTYAVLVGIAMIGCQYLFCRYWFSSHQRGPLEGLWRRLTWING